MHPTPIILTGGDAFKECIGCRNFKPLLDFPRNERSPSERNSRCKPCYNTRPVNGESVREYLRKRCAAKPRPIDDNQIIVTAAGNFRICQQCFEVKATDDFYGAPYLTDGIRKECKDCVGKNTTEYIAQNADKVRAFGIAYRQTERAKQLQKERSLRWLEKHGAAEHVRKVNEWRKNNPEKQKINSDRYRHRRRARLAKASGVFDYNAWMKKVDYHGWKCFYCPKILTLKTLTIEHRKALSVGGSNWVSNLVPACKSCNSSKGVKAWREK